MRLLRARVGLIGDDDDPADLVGVSTQAGSDLPGDSFQAKSGLKGDAASEPRLLSEPSMYLGLVFRVLVLRRTFFGVGVGAELLLSIAAGLSVFVGVVLTVQCQSPTFYQITYTRAYLVVLFPDSQHHIPHQSSHQ